MANYEERGDRFTAVEDDFAGYTVLDNSGEKIGKVDDLFLDENDQPEYFGVKMGFLGTKSTLIPADIANIDRERGFVEVSQLKQKVKDGPAFDDDSEITPEYENEVRSYYGLQSSGTSGDKGGYGGYYSDSDEDHETRASGTGHTDEERHDRKMSTEGSPGMRMGDTESGEFRDHEHEREGVHQPGSDLEDEDELRIQRSEEELTAGTREREAGAMNVRKRVRTDREQIKVPKKREEVSVERVPVEGREASEAEIGEDEITMPVVEEEVVVGKQAVVKEEIKVRKDVVHDEEVVEEDVRKEEVDIEDSTERDQGIAGHGDTERDAKGDEETRRRRDR
ncbi:MAG: PRC and DUF2382 domain-containing protein [Rubrobacter sp.]|nr:PRC and DUF2382 domain-containing protein [Rubrobacter sp.]